MTSKTEHCGGGFTPFTDDFNAYLEHLRRHFHVPSVSIGVVDSENTFINAFGDAQVSGVKATSDTLYFIASVTKSFTATTLLSVLEDLEDQPDAITLNTKISSIIRDDFVLQDDYATSHATLEDALAHTLGVGNHNLSYGGDDYTVRDAVRSLRHLSMTAEFRAKHQYLNLGYMVIQHVIETVTGKPIEESHKKYIWDPLGMPSTFIRLSDAQEAENVLAGGYTWDALDKRLVEVEYARDYPLVGGGGIISSIKDLTNYLGTVIYKAFPLDTARQEELFKPRVIAGDAPYEHMSTPLYALGWRISSYRGRRLVSHSGGISGFASKLVFLPDLKWGVAILANSDSHGGFANEAAIMRLMDDFLNVPKESRLDLIPIYDKLVSDRIDGFLNRRNTLYPCIPQPPLPLMLPLSEYAGSYHNPGYRTLVLTVARPLDGSPVADRTKNVLHTELKRLVNLTLDLEHVSDQFFIAWAATKIPSSSFRNGTRSQFTLGSNGKVDKWGINLDPLSFENDKYMMVWFTKVE